MITSNMRFFGKTLREKTIPEMAVGCLRYECVRKMNPMKFKEICLRNLKGEGTFDDLIDAEIEKEAGHE